MSDLLTKARYIIQRIEYATIATVDKTGQPWNAPVFTAFDDEYNFYWGTYENSQKAINIRNNPNIFINIYDSTAPSGHGEGVYIKATAEQLSNLEEIEFGWNLLKKRHSEPFWDDAAKDQTNPIRVFKAKVVKSWINDGSEANGHYIDIRTEVKL